MSDAIQRIETPGIFEIHVNRPDKKNALTADMYREMTAILAEVSSRPDISVVILTSEGDTFCAGNDLADFLEGPVTGSAAFDFIRAISTFGKPVIAAVQGPAVGIGTTMLFHCDLVYATPEARFLMPFVNLGIVPEAGSSLIAPALMGYQKAAAMLLLGEPMDALAANTAGLVTQVIARGTLPSHVHAKAVALCAKPPQALAATRRLMKGDPVALAERIDEEGRLFRETMQSAEAREAFTAFLERRPRQLTE